MTSGIAKINRKIIQVGAKNRAIHPVFRCFMVHLLGGGKSVECGGKRAGRTTFGSPLREVVADQVTGLGGGKVRQNLTELLGVSAPEAKLGSSALKVSSKPGTIRPVKVLPRFSQTEACSRKSANRGKRVQCGLGDFHGGTGGNHALAFPEQSAGPWGW